MDGNQTLILNKQQFTYTARVLSLVFHIFMIHYSHGFEYKIKSLKHYLIVIEAAGPLYRDLQQTYRHAQVTYEPVGENTNNLGSDQVRHTGSTVTEDA